MWSVIPFIFKTAVIVAAAHGAEQKLRELGENRPHLKAAMSQVVKAEQATTRAIGKVEHAAADGAEHLLEAYENRTVHPLQKTKEVTRGLLHKLKDVVRKKPPATQPASK